MPFAKREYEYYKYGTEPNASVAGNFARIDKSVASGFSTSQYLKLPEAFNPQSNPWEALFKVKINTLINGGQVILGQRNGGGYNFYVDINKVRLEVGGATFTGATTLQENTTYWFNYTFTGDAYIVKSSTNGVDWVDEINTASTVTATPTSDDCRIGVWYNTYNSGLGNPFLGSIDLNESYININGSRWWSGDNHTKVGSWIDDGVVSGFSASAYLKLLNAFNPEINPWEVLFKFKLTEVTPSSWHCLLGSAEADYSAGLNLHITSGKVSCEYSSNNSSWNIGKITGDSTLSANTDYWVKTGWTGGQYYLSLSTNGIDYVSQGIIDSTVPLKAIKTQSIGIAAYDAATYLRGAIDLNESHIKMNSKLWWHGTKAYQVNLNGEDVWEEFKRPSLSSDGVMGGETFAVAVSSYYSSAVAAYKAFTADGRWQSAAWATGDQWLTFYNPNAIKLRKIKLKYGNTESYYYLKGMYIQGSNDNVSWETLYTYTANSRVTEITCEVNSNTAYKYHRLYVYDRAYYNTENSFVMLNVAEIDAQELVQVGGNDYDYSITRNKLYQLVKPKRTYYKYGDEIDAGVVGSFGRITDGVASGFSSEKYLEFPKAFDVSQGQDWEIVFSFITGSVFYTMETLLSKTENTAYQCRFGLSDGKPFAALSNTSATSSGSTFLRLGGNGEVLQKNTSYLMKLEYKTGVYSLYLSKTIDIANWELVESKEDSTIFISTKFNRIGYGYDSGDGNQFTFKGLIDLSKSYININGERWWSGDEYVTIGSWVDDGIAQNFSSSNYLTLPKNFDVADGSNWEMVWKITTPKSLTSAAAILCRNSSSGYASRLYIENDKSILLALSNNSSNWLVKISGGSVTPNTEYLIKCNYYEGVYSLYVSENVDSPDWVLLGTQEAGAYTQTDFTRIGYGYDSGSGVGYAMDGSIDLTKSYIKINNKMWWHGTKSYELNVKGGERSTSWKQPVLTGNSSNFSFVVSDSKNDSTYLCFDNDKSTGISPHTAAGSFSNKNYWVQMVSSRGLNITNIAVTNRNISEAQAITAGSVQVSDNGTDWMKVTDWTNSNTGNAATWNIPVSYEGYYKYVRLVITDGYSSNSGNWIKVNGIDLTATQLLPSGTIEEADYYETKLISYTPILRNAKHYVTLFESEKGGTYSVTIPEDCVARVTAVGGGGRATYQCRYDDRGYIWTGGSGAAYKGELQIPAGTYNVTVGSCASGGNRDTVIENIITVAGGSDSAGAGGVAPVISVESTNEQLNTAGNSGAYYASGNGGSGATWNYTGAASVYKSYGRGGGGKVCEYDWASSANEGSGDPYNPTDGYVRIEIMSLTEKQLY